MLHAYGAKFVKRLRKLRVAIVGARGVGVEVAKCLTLSGVRLLHIFDDEHVRARDLGSNFALQSNDIGKPRAAATVPFLQRLNESVSVSAMAGLPDPDHYDVIVATRISRASAGALNAACRASVKVRPWAVDETKEADQKLGSQGVPPPPLYPCAFISADAFGVASTIFSDFGPGHVVESVAGQPDIVANIKQVFSGEQTFIEVCNSDKRPVNDLNEGDSCVFNGVAGCDAADVFVVANMKSVFEVVKGVKTAVANLFELLRRDSSGRLTAVNSSAWPSCRCHHPLQHTPEPLMLLQP
jgi:ubiquitin-activating enzyme E1